jgi:hypothetical protein
VDLHTGQKPQLERTLNEHVWDSLRSSSISKRNENCHITATNALEIVRLLQHRLNSLVLVGPPLSCARLLRFNILALWSTSFQQSRSVLGFRWLGDSAAI